MAIHGSLIQKPCHHGEQNEIPRYHESERHRRSLAWQAYFRAAEGKTRSKNTGSINGPCGRQHAINPQYRIDINWPRGSTIKTLRRRTASLRVIIAGLMPHRPGGRTPMEHKRRNTPRDLVAVPRNATTKRHGWTEGLALCSQFSMPLLSFVRFRSFFFSFLFLFFFQADSLWIAR